MDFTSALYLGWHHAKADLPNWNQLSLGKPSILEELPVAGAVAQAVARLQQQESGVLFPSTLHLFWDLFNWLSKQPVAIFYDRDAYPVATQVLQAIHRKNRVRIYSFSHLDQPGLQKKIRQCYRIGLRSAIVSDGWCTQCGQALPLLKYVRWLAPYEGLLILDDTQSIGILGQRNLQNAIYGTGGGGILPWLALNYENILSGSSLAKGFGIPLAVLSGEHQYIKAIRRSSFTRMHCSPPTIDQVYAAQQVINNNTFDGERRRKHLQERIRQFKQQFRGVLPEGPGNIFPVQHLKLKPKGTPIALSQYLKKRGIRTLLTSSHHGEPTLTFLIRADHQASNLHQLAHTLDIALTELNVNA